MSPEMVAALIAAPFTVIVATITAWATLKVHSIRRERRVNLILPRLEAYKTLWSLMEDLRTQFYRPDTSELETGERDDIAGQLHNWYFANGNGIFLSPKARDQFVKTKANLLHHSCSITFEALLNEFSDMRYLMRTDIGAYEDLSVSDRFTNVFSKWGRKTGTERKAGNSGDPIGRRGGTSAASTGSAPEPGAGASEPGYYNNKGQHYRPPLGSISSRIRQHKAEDGSGHDGPPFGEQDTPTDQPDKPDS